MTWDLLVLTWDLLILAWDLTLDLFFNRDFTWDLVLTADLRLDSGPVGLNSGLVGFYSGLVGLYSGLDSGFVSLDLRLKQYWRFLLVVVLSTTTWN